MIVLRVPRDKLSKRGRVCHGEASNIGLLPKSWPVFIVLTGDGPDTRYGNRTVDGDTVIYNTPGYGYELHIINDLSPAEVL
jgi:hypothetical protein